MFLNPLWVLGFGFGPLLLALDLASSHCALGFGSFVLFTALPRRRISVAVLIYDLTRAFFIQHI